MTRLVCYVYKKKKNIHLTACVSLFIFQPQDDYMVLFEDTSYPDGYSPPLGVAQRYVIACKEEKRK